MSTNFERPVWVVSRTWNPALWIKFVADLNCQARAPKSIFSYRDSPKNAGLAEENLEENLAHGSNRGADELGARLPMEKIHRKFSSTTARKD